MIASGPGWIAHSLDTLLERVAGLEPYWLHWTEAEQLRRFRSEERRRSWLGGRVAAKQLLLWEMRWSGCCPHEIEICSRCVNNLGRPPIARFGDGSPSMAISISHTRNIVSVAVASHDNTRVGIDAVELAESDDRHLATWLSPSESAWIREDRGPCIAEIWAAKEAAFKTLPDGLPFRPTQCRIRPGNEDEWVFHVRESESSYAGLVQTWRNRDCVIALATRSIVEPADNQDFVSQY